MIQIGSKIIAKSAEPFIIAEVGINHNGSLDNAFEMIKVAKESGANCVKFQTFKADEFVSDKNQMFTYKSQGKDVTESMLEMFRRYEFTEDNWKAIKRQCDEIGITFMSTPQNKSDLDLLLKLGIPAIKVGSDDFTNIPLMREYSKSKLPMFVSMGMSDLAEVYQTLTAIGTFEGYPTVLFLCTSQYPTPKEDVNLLKLKTLSGAFPNLILGFSDHTQGPLASSLAVAMGAVVFEKHFTLSHDLPGPDHWFSEDPKGLKEWIDGIRTSYSMMGSELVRPTNKELENKKEFQRVIVAVQNINKGDTFITENIGMMRISGGDGLPGYYYKFILNKTALKDYTIGEPIFL
jgi:N,N'-diacetyllegionaminate synthase